MDCDDTKLKESLRRAERTARECDESFRKAAHATKRAIRAFTKEEMTKPRPVIKAPSFYNYSLTVVENRIDELMRRQWHRGLIAYPEWTEVEDGLA